MRFKYCIRVSESVSEDGKNQFVYVKMENCQFRALYYSLALMSDTDEYLHARISEFHKLDFDVNVQ